MNRLVLGCVVVFGVACGAGESFEAIGEVLRDAGEAMADAGAAMEREGAAQAADDAGATDGGPAQGSPDEGDMGADAAAGPMGDMGDDSSDAPTRLFLTAQCEPFVFTKITTTVNGTETAVTTTYLATFAINGFDPEAHPVAAVICDRGSPARLDNSHNCGREETNRTIECAGGIPRLHNACKSAEFEVAPSMVRVACGQTQNDSWIDSQGTETPGFDNGDWWQTAKITVQL